MLVSLENRSWYSLLEGFSSPEDLIATAKEFGYQALALTDTNSLMGLPAFVDAANRVGIRPLTGATLGWAGKRFVALAATMDGYASLSRLVTLAKRLELQGQGGWPEFLSCLEAEGAHLHFLVDDPDWLRAMAPRHPGRVWALVARPFPGRERSRARFLESQLLEAAVAVGVKPVASARVMMNHPQKLDTARVLWAVRNRELVDHYPIPGDCFPGNALPEPGEWERRFADLPQALSNAADLAERLQADLVPRTTIFPSPARRRGVSDEARLKHLCRKGLRLRGLEAESQAQKRLDRELELIVRLGFTGYFLVVRSIARKARRMGLSMALRGSAGNSLVCYLLEITEVDPLRFALPLERFLHEGRTDLPDIDLDFDWKNRDAIIDWAIRHFGAGRTCRISSHLFFQPRVAFRESCRCHGLSNQQITQLTQNLKTSAEVLVKDPPAASRHGLPWSFPLEPQRWWRILDDARLLVGLPHHLSIHPGGIVMVPDRIDSYVPIQRSAKGVDVTQFDKYSIESTGLVKIDLLGNRALSTVDEVARMWNARGWSLPALRDDDERVLSLLQNGDSLGVGQLESPGMRHLLVQLAPRRIDDVILALALIRPGAAGIGMKSLFCARRRGKEPPADLHPLVAELLRETDGMLVFEDDGLRLLQGLTGMSPPQADRFRKRIAKNHDPAQAELLRREFLEASEPSGVSLSQREELWRQLEKFNLYSFCKSHAVSYGLIAWRSAWFKVTDPVRFWTAALNNNQGMYPRRVYTEAILRQGIRLWGPCVNRSEQGFSVESMPGGQGEGIRTGLGAILGLNQAYLEQLLKERESHGSFSSFEDFRKRIATPPETMELLFQSGALDGFAPSRASLKLKDQMEVNAGWNRKGPEMFAALPDSDWAVRELDDVEKCREEYRLLGFPVTQPLFRLMKPVIRDGMARLGHFPDHWCLSDQIPSKLGKEVMVAGMVAAARATHTKNGNLMQFLTLEDEKGFVDLTLFPGTCPILTHITAGPYIAFGKVEEDMGVYTVTATRVLALHEKGPVVPIIDEIHGPQGWEEWP